jgi:predicted phosphodiesterase
VNNALFPEEPQINDLIRPDFVQFIGDNVQDGTDKQFALFKDLVRRLQTSWYALVGDLDAQKNPDAVSFQEWIGDTCGSLSLGGFRFVRLNTQQANPVGLSSEQLGWFRRVVDEARAMDERIVIFQHNYPYQIWEDFDGTGIDGWWEIVQTRRIHAILCGHTHYWQVANDGRNAMVATRSIGDPEGGPPGYTLAVFDGEDFAVVFRSIADRGPIVLITHPREAILATGPTHVVKGPDEVRMRVWSRDAVELAGYQIDAGPWKPMERIRVGEWRGPIDGDRLSKGVHRLAVRVEADGAGEQQIEFAVDPTGRFTAVPAVRPIATSTKFC